MGIQLYMFDLLELLQCQNFVRVQLNEVSCLNCQKAIPGSCACMYILNDVPLWVL